ncbi:cytochrome P450 [Streptomyces flaveolus]|uniref:cytochrome P450 n=1 Tax=Streptomyces flaveolus TaxID=67297 RepID=UPI003433A809
MLLAGFVTTVNLTGNALHALLGAPERREEAAGDWSAVVEETLRHSSPLRYVVRRAREDTEVEGHEVAAGTPVVVMPAGANRDPAVFDRPDECVIGRAGAGRVGTSPSVPGSTTASVRRSPAPRRRPYCAASLSGTPRRPWRRPVGRDGHASCTAPHSSPSISPAAPGGARPAPDAGRGRRPVSRRGWGCCADAKTSAADPPATTRPPSPPSSRHPRIAPGVSVTSHRQPCTSSLEGRSVRAGGGVFHTSTSR